MPAEIAAAAFASCPEAPPTSMRLIGRPPSCSAQNWCGGRGPVESRHVVGSRHRQQTVDVVEGHPGVVEGAANRLELKGEGRPVRQLALLGVVHPDDGGLALGKAHPYPPNLPM